ncbi:MAG: D-alanyl-D-alanine carboxypeptidase/D-alanyl-D-alanine endopeptidase [Acidimicrobiales bacterium]
MRRWSWHRRALAFGAGGAVAVATVLSAGVPSLAAAAGSRAQARAATPVLSARRLPDFLLRVLATERVRASIGAAWTPTTLGAAASTSCLQVAAGDQVIDQENVSTPLLPASNMKLLTASAALDKLGPDYRFTTEVKASQAPAGGTVAGSLYLVGGGDPLLRTPGYAAGLPFPEPTYTSLVQLAARVRAAGVRRVLGSVIGDESRFDQQRGISTWKPAYEAEGDVGPLSALQVNDGFERIVPPPPPPTTLPQPPTTTTTTTLPGVTTTTAPGGPPPSTSPPTTRPPTTRPPTTRPGAPDGAPPPSIQVPAPQPAIQAAQVFAGLLAADGVEVAGGQSNGVAPPAAPEITSIDSAPLNQVVGVILRSSDDTGTELLTKELGHRFGGAGTTAAGLSVIKADLAADGLPMTGFAAVDGSGLDRSDRVTCALLAADLARSGPSSVLATALPVAGRSGTLEHRLTQPPAAGRVEAKTGSLDGVSALSGFIPAPASPPSPNLASALTFAVVVNGLATEASGERLIDLVASALARFPDVPERSAILPAPPVG